MLFTLFLRFNLIHAYRYASGCTSLSRMLDRASDPSVQHRRTCNFLTGIILFLINTDKIKYDRH